MAASDGGLRSKGLTREQRSPNRKGGDKGGQDAVRDGTIQRIRRGGTHVVIGQRRLGALQRMVRGAVALHEEGVQGLHQEVGLLEEG